MINTALLIVTVIVSMLSFSNDAYRRKLIFNPYLVEKNKEWYRFITSGFIHSDILHLAVNMFVLYSFGAVVESYFNAYFAERGSYYFLLLYFASRCVLYY